MEQMSTQTAQPTGGELVYNTRFGDVTLREDRLISFPEGILGFGDCTVFGLSRVPNASDSPLMLLQCVNDPQVVFIVADPASLGVEIHQEDRKKALKERKMDEETTQFLVLLTLYDQGDSYYMTCNTKAPLLVDSANRVAVQHILDSREYTTQHKL